MGIEIAIHAGIDIKKQDAYARSLYRNLNKTLYYLDVFARFKDEENIKAVERLLNSHTELEMFERSQLGEFDCTAPECRSMVATG